MTNIYAQLKIAGIRVNAAGQIHRDDVDKAEPILLKHIQAGPMNVLDTEFGLDTPTKNLSMYKDLQKRKGTKLKDFGEYQLYEYPTYIALLHIPSKSVAYIVQFERKMLFGKRAVTQIMLWRQIGNDFVENLKIDGMKLTSYVFFKVLFAKNDCIVTDSMQTGMGKRFWGDRIGNALAYGYPVYYINQVTKDKVLITDENKQAVVEKYKIWGDDEISKAKKIAICKDQFWKPTQEI
jgi:hypothetical protein